MEIGLVTLLRLGWIAWTLPILISSIPWSKLNWYHDLFLGVTKRGKTMQSSSSSLQKFRVLQKFFCHFYALGAIWTTILLVATWLYAYNMAPLLSESLQFPSITSYLTGGSHSFWLHGSNQTKMEKRYRIWLSVFLLLLMEAQVLRRLWETIYVFKYSPSAQMHICGYVTGFYSFNVSMHPFIKISESFLCLGRWKLPKGITCLPILSSLLMGRSKSVAKLIIVVYGGQREFMALCYTYASEVFQFASNLIQEFIVKGKDQMQSAETNWYGLVNPLIKLKWHVWLGATIFWFGWIHQHRCHVILDAVREKSEGTEDYAIPYGDWFRYVSCPHYFAEIGLVKMKVIYAGLLIACGFSDITIWLVFGFVVANLVFADAA